MRTLNRYRQSQSDVVKLAERELNSFWLSLDPSTPLAAVNALERFLPDLIVAYGDIGATVAADFYEELREDVAGLPTYKTVLAPPIPIEQAVISTKWAVGPLFREIANPDAALSNLSDVADRLIKQAGRNTIDYNARRDTATVRYARVPTGAETCNFCKMLASRGAVYVSRDTAGAQNRFHGKCDCAQVPIWSNDDYERLKQEAGYDPDALLEEYKNA